MTRESPLWLQPATGDPAINYSAQQDRTLFDALLTSAGVMTESALQVSQRGAGANFSVDVAPGWCAINGTSIAYQGKYMCRSTAVENVALPASPGSGTRTDGVYAVVNDSQVDSSGLYSWVFTAVAGNSPVPANSLLLATVSRSSGESSVVNSAISDARVLAHAFNSDQVTTANALLGLGTFNPAKIRKRLNGYVETTTSIYGGVNLPLPGGTTAVLGCTVTPAFRVPNSGQTGNYTPVVRLDASNLSNIVLTCYPPAGGSGLNTVNVAFTYDITYQQ